MLNECHISAQHYVQIPHNASLAKKKGILPNFPSPCGVNLYTKSFHQTLRTVGSLRLGHLLTSLPCCCTRSGRNPVDRLHRAFLDPGYPGKATSWSIVCRSCHVVYSAAGADWRPVLPSVAARTAEKVSVNERKHGK